MHLRIAREEQGFTMIAIVGAIALLTVLVGAALAATNADLHLVRRDLDDKRAYAAAQAGIADYSFHLNNDTGYWARCTNVPSPHAVNQQGSTANRRAVPGSTDGSTYAIELLPATGHSACDPNDPVDSMLEQTPGPSTGTFRIRSTGYARDTKQSIVATFRQASFLDFLYFTQYETSDPVTYGFPNPSQQLTGAYSQCEKWRRQGRENQPIPNTGGLFCDRIVFVASDILNGPVHTNDDFAICGAPQFGRSASDVTEVSAGPPGWFNGGCGGGANPVFLGPFVTNAPVLTPPPTNGGLKNIAGPSYTYTGETQIVLSGNSMRINGGSPQPIPASGVVYVESGLCASSYSPFTATYPSGGSGCGNAIVHSTGGYTGQLTIAAENDILIDGDITRSADGMLGMIANNFVRVKHPICPANEQSCNNGTITTQTGKGQCNGGQNGNGSIQSLRVDAAILAIDHSFIVDHYDCGAQLGTLTVNGAIAQKYRGAVGTTGGHGYFKAYSYDDRLKYRSPPHFFDPVEAAWHVQRETLDFP